MAKDPQTIAQNWASRMGASTQKISDGIDAVQVAPGVAAARQKDVWRNNTMNAADKYARNVQAVSLEEWRQAAKGKGLNRIGPGATAAMPKMANLMTQLMPYIQAGKGKLPPRGDQGTNKARMDAWFDHMVQFKYNK